MSDKQNDNCAVVSTSPGTVILEREREPDKKRSTNPHLNLNGRENVNYWMHRTSARCGKWWVSSRSTKFAIMLLHIHIFSTEGIPLHAVYPAWPSGGAGSVTVRGGSSNRHCSSLNESSDEWHAKKQNQIFVHSNQSLLLIYFIFYN